MSYRKFIFSSHTLSGCFFYIQSFSAECYANISSMVQQHYPTKEDGFLQPHSQASSLHSSLEEETLVNVGHVAPRFLKPACEGLWVVLVNVCNFNFTYK